MFLPSPPRPLGTHISEAQLPHVARHCRYNKNTGFMGTAGLVTRHSGEQGLHKRRKTFTASRRDSQRQENRVTRSWGFKPKGARGGGGGGWSGPGTGVRSLRLGFGSGSGVRGLGQGFGSGSGVRGGSGVWGGIRSLSRVWGLDQGSALGLGLGQGFGPESRIWAGSGVSVCVGFQSPGWVWGLSLRLSPESGRRLGSRSRFWVGVPGLAPRPQPSPGRRTAPAPTAEATGSGTGQWGRGAARRGQWEAAEGGAPDSAAGRKALEGGGRGAVAT